MSNWLARTMLGGQSDTLDVLKLCTLVGMWVQNRSDVGASDDQSQMLVSDATSAGTERYCVLHTQGSCFLIS